MKIGLDVRCWNESGVGRYIRNLVNELQKIDMKNEYCLFADKNNLPSLVNKNWKIVTTDFHWHSFEEQVKFPDLINRENIDLMHFPYFSMPVLYKRPYVVTIHDLILHYFATGKATTRSQLTYKFKLLAYKYIISSAAKNSSKIITVSNATKNEIVLNLNVPAEKVKVTYEGVDELFEDQISGGAFCHSNYFLHVGNLYPHKNIEIVISAIKKLKEEFRIPVKLLIIGKEDFFYRRFKDEVNKYGLDKEIIFCGEVPDSFLRDAYRNALALISPSLMEGFDLPSAEAMINNCLVLASDIPAHREICDNSAVYFDLQSGDDLLCKIKEIYKHGRGFYKEKIKSGKSRALLFKWKDMAKKTLDIYENCISI